jgi:hypothetical protein
MAKVALYSLTNRIAGFDFFPWLVMQKHGGADEVAFDISQPRSDKWPLDLTMKRFESICWPGPALLGMPAKKGDRGRQFGGYHQRELVALCKTIGPNIPRLKSVLPPGKEKYTVTLRNTQRTPIRNSNVEDWKTFAAEIGARVIPDYDDVPIHLHERMALYAGAEMNFFVTNGPVMSCFLSEYPAMGFDVQKSPMKGFGVPFGESYPWLLKDRHFQVYEPDTLENMRKHFAAWKRTGAIEPV